MVAAGDGAVVTADEKLDNRRIVVVGVAMVVFHHRHKSLLIFRLSRSFAIF